MPPTQNQARAGLPNILHDEGVPNTLSRIGPAVPIGQMRLPMGAFVVVTVAFVVLLAILVGLWA
jgi:hypothetical protein